MQDFMSSVNSTFSVMVTIMVYVVKFVGIVATSVAVTYAVLHVCISFSIGKAIICAAWAMGFCIAVLTVIKLAPKS